MDEKWVQVLAAISFFFIGLFFVAGDILGIIGITDRNTNALISNSLSWLVFILCLLTAIFMLTELKREE